MTVHQPKQGGQAGEPVPAATSDPGRLNAVQLARYWRKESAAAAKRMASRFGIRCIAGRYPWMAIWSAEGLAAPPASSWRALQQSHLTTDDVAVLLACDARTIRRYAQNPPDSSFPPPVFETGKPLLWRTCQIHAYVTGRPVPRFRRARPVKTTRVSPSGQAPVPREPKANTFDPFCSQ